ncbi:MAG: nitroreductase [Clostridia bacterium]|nr:nitroreductase [Clostridia bacterium]
MNEVMQNILTRRSVKKYLPDPVEESLIEQVLEAGRYAATGRNRQAPIILAVTNKLLRDALSKMNARVMGAGEGVDPFYGAPVVLVVLADKSVNTRVYDGSLVMGNMMLAAHSLGLGSCWIHRAKEEFESEEGKEILKTLGVTGEYEGIGHLVLGYAAEKLPQPKPRKENWVYYAK